MAANLRGVKLRGLCFLALVLSFYAVTSAGVQVQSTPKSYVVYMGSRAWGPGISPAHLHRLTGVMGTSSLATESLIYSYDNFNAFAATLTREQAASLAAQEDVISVLPNTDTKLHTTHSWAYLGLEDSFGEATPDSLWTKSDYGKDVIIGVIDTGVWPESKSFNDAGLGPIPAKWKGECTTGELFGPSYCNKKLIGGQFFLKGFEAEYGPLNTTITGDYRSARDLDGHGTHTISTAGGSFAPGASLLGFANGTAKGGAPKARVAMYKVCWDAGGGCTFADILKAFDKGISDGVDVFSVSLGAAPTSKIDLAAVGAFHAYQYNISVVYSAGNDGPTPETVSNAFPWMTTVAASTIDRDFPAHVTLGNGTVIKGGSIAEERLKGEFFPLISAESFPAVDFNSSQSAYCFPRSLDTSKVYGKIVLCQGVSSIRKGQEVQNAGGVGMIITKNDVSVRSYTLPTIEIPSTNFSDVLSYVNYTSSPEAKISGGKTVFGFKPAPLVAPFSSQGPNIEVPDILKPDIAAPGVSILAAYSQVARLGSTITDTRRTAYTFLSGTSMSCPHVAGTIASLKAYHPTWSPAALHSAIVTTATGIDNTGEKIKNFYGEPATPFEIGGGELNPNGAAEPGLVYDNPPSAYYAVLCSMGYNSAEVAAITGTAYKCPALPVSVSDFNYPSLTVSNVTTNETFVKRTVTNVGNPTSTYTVSIEPPEGIKTIISPSTLSFKALGEELSFTVELRKTKRLKKGVRYHFGSFTWSDGTHLVRSRIVVGI